MNREQALAKAIEAARTAEKLAADAERTAHHTDYHSRAPIYAAASGAWSDTARAYVALAAQLPADDKTEA